MTTWPDSIWLVGLSAAGKSTVGPLLADRLGYEFIDLDDRIEAERGRTVAEIFGEEGEESFRGAEARVSAALLGRPRIVVATGGGWMAREDIPRNAVGCVRVWLRVSPEAAIARLGEERSTRPLLDGVAPLGSIEGLLARRIGHYREAEVTIDTDGMAPLQVVDAVLQWLRRDDGTEGEQTAVRRAN